MIQPVIPSSRNCRTAAGERGEPLVPQPIREKVVERDRLSVKRVDAASQAVEAEVKRVEQQVWRVEKEARRPSLVG